MEFDKKVLCLGNNSLDTDTVTRRLAKEASTACWGLITEIKNVEIGYYHSSIYDVNFEKLLGIIKRFDSLIVLDQSWSDPDMLVKTIELATVAESFIDVCWLNDSYKIANSFFKNLVETNKSFCIYPFIELLVQNGSTTVCCRSYTPITALDKLQDWQTDPKYKKIRDKMLAGKLLPDHCQTCYSLESKNIISPRKKDTVEWANRLGITSIDDLSNIKTPVYYEVRPSNICNLQCRSCGPQSSNLIEKEYIKIGLHDTDIIYTYFDFSIINFDNLRSLYLAGGEPTAMPELYEFLEKCISTNNVDFDFTINTNAVKFSDKLKKLFSHFTNLQFIVSIDGYKEVNHYVRWPSEWGSIIENIQYLIDQGHNVIFQSVVSIWTVSRFHQLLKFIDDKFTGLSIHIIFATSTDDLFSPFNFPDRITTKNNLKQITELKFYQNDLVFKNTIDGLIKYFETAPPFDEKKLKRFFEFNDRLDQSRNIRLKDYIPELEEYRKYVL